MELLTKEKILGVIKSARTEFVKLLAQTAYDSMAKCEEMQERLKLFAGAVKDQTKIDELQDQVRRLQEQIAQLQVNDPKIVIALESTGFVKVFSEVERNIKFLCLPAFTGPHEQEAYQWALSRLPLSHRELMTSGDMKVQSTGHIAGCITLASWKLLQIDLGIRAINRLQALEPKVEAAT